MRIMTANAAPASMPALLSLHCPATQPARPGAIEPIVTEVHAPSTDSQQLGRPVSCYVNINTYGSRLYYSTQNTIPVLPAEKYCPDSWMKQRCE